MAIPNNQDQQSDEQWSEIMADYESSNLSQKAFCALHGINFKDFVNSRYRIAYHNKKRIALKTSYVKSKSFAEVKVASASTRILKVIHPNGIECSLPLSLSEPEILAVIRGLQAC